MDKSRMTIATYNKTASIYTDKWYSDDSDHKYIDKFIRLLPRKSKVLDVGCGPGNFTNYLLKNGCIAEGIDLSEEMLKIARIKNPSACFFLMDMRHLDYPDSVFDGILSAYSIIHIPTEHILATLKGFYRVLNKNGIVEIITQQGEPDQVVNDHLKVTEKMFYNFFTKKRIADFLQASGFRIHSQELHVVSNTYNLSDGIIYTIARK